MALSIVGTTGAMARNKSDTIKPNPPSVAKGKSATIPVELPTVDVPATEKGIKDAGGCPACGPVRDAPRPSSGKAGRPKVRDDSPLDPSATERGVKSIPGIKHSKTLSLLTVVGGLAGLSAVIALAASGGDDKPASP